MKFVAFCLLAICVTISVEGKSYKFEENIDTRNEVIDKILEELIKVKNEAKEFLHDAEGRATKAITKALEDFDILKNKVQDAATKGKEISQELIAKAKAEILEDYLKVKPIIEDLKDKAKSKLEDIIKKIKESDAVAEIKQIADKVKAYITNFIDHIPDYEETLKVKFEEVKVVVHVEAEIVKEKFEEVKAVVIEEAKIVKEKLVKVEHEAQQKLEGLILIAEKILKEQVAPKVKSEVDALIALAKVKLQAAGDFTNLVVEKAEEKINSILEVIDDKTHGVAGELIKKYEAKLRALIASAEEHVSSLNDKASEWMDEIKSKIADALQMAYKRQAVSEEDDGHDHHDHHDGHNSISVSIRINKRNAVIDKILEELIRVKNEAKEFLHKAEGKAKEALKKALEDFNTLRGKIQDAEAKGKEISKELIAKAKAAILENYRKVKPIIEDLKTKVKSKIEDIIEQIEQSAATAEIKAIAQKVKAYITNFIDDIPDYEEILKEKFEEVEAIVIEEAKTVKERLAKVAQKALHKLEGMILIAEKFLKEKVSPKIKSEVDALIAKANVKLQVAQDAADALAEKMEEKIEALLEKINDKTHGVADGQIKKYEAKLKALIMEAEEKISSLKDKTSKLMDEIKSKIDDLLARYVFYSVDTRSAGIDFAVEKIMKALEKPFTKVPENVREWLTAMVEEAVRFAMEHGKTGAKILLDLIAEKAGEDVKPVIDIIKITLDQYV